MKTTKKTVSLILGSGGARGLAHIGIIRCLEECGYEIRSIAGASMGALIGGIYAAGKLHIYEEWVSALRKRDVMQLLDFAYSRAGLFSGDRIITKLRNMLGDVGIEELPISFTAVATDLNAGREIWLTHGSLFDAIRASIAIPTIFTPISYDGRLLVDGGLLNPVPIAPTLKDITDLTIAVSLSGKPEQMIEPEEVEHDNGHGGNRYRRAIAEFVAGIQSRLNHDEKQAETTSMFELTSRSLEAMQNMITHFKLAAYNTDYLIEVPVDACSVFEFHRAREMIELGYNRARQALKESD